MTTKTVRLEPQDAPLISEDGLIVQIPLLITQKVAESAKPEEKNSQDQQDPATSKTELKPEIKSASAADDLINEITDPNQKSKKQTANQETASELTILQADSLRIFLEDTDGIMNLEPTRLQIQGRADDPPVVQTRLAGVGKSVTRKAIIPLSGTVSDDYGLSELFFDYRLETDESPRIQPVTRLQPGEQLFVMEKTSANPTEKLDIMPLELKVNDILLISLVAKDADNLNGPHMTRGETYRMKIVSDEELLSLLHQDEMNLRRRFEHVIDELTRSRNDLASAATNQQENPGPETATQVSEAIQRTLNMVQKDAVETDAIRVAFEGIREEMLNNRVDTPQIRSRLEGKIIEPLARVIDREFSLAEENLRLLDFSLRTREATQLTPEKCVQDVDQILVQLAQILQEMRKLESFQEVIELLKAIIDDERALKEKTEAERKKKLIDLLN